MATSGSEIYAAFIEAELKVETDRRDSVHTRAGAAVTSSVGLITLVLGVFGYLAGKNPGFPDCAKPFLVVAVIFLLVAGGFAVAAGFPVGQKYVSDSTLNSMLESHRNDSEERARDAVTYINAVGLLSLRRGTTRKVVLLFVSGICQIVAMVAIGGCIWAVVANQPQPDTGPPTTPTVQPQPDTAPTAAAPSRQAPVGN
jgi:hypothetical protein